MRGKKKSSKCNLSVGGRTAKGGERLVTREKEDISERTEEFSETEAAEMTFDNR